MKKHYKLFALIIALSFIIQMVCSCTKSPEITTELEFDGFILKRNCDYETTFYEDSTETIYTPIYQASYYIHRYNGDAETVVIPDTAPDGLPITAIGGWAFSGNEHVKKVVVSNAITAIYECAFINCSNLESVTIGSSVVFMEPNDMFGYCNNLTSITVSENNPVYRSEGNCIIDVYAGAVAFGCSASIIPNEEVESIGYGAFSCVESLESIEVPENIKHIDDWAFSNCTGLKTVFLGDNIKVVDAFAFLGCSEATIYCSAESKPDDWHERWITSSNGRYEVPEVVWQYNATAVSSD